MTQSADILFSLLRAALFDVKGIRLPESVEWSEVIDLSYRQGIAPLAVDGLQAIDYDINPVLNLLDSPLYEKAKYGWYCSCLEAESGYSSHMALIRKLATLFSDKKISLLILKGYGLSLNYPVPDHRTSSDIDIFLFGRGAEGDKLVQECYGCDVKQNEDRHSVYRVDGVTVENHACFANPRVHPSMRDFNDFLAEEASKGDYCEVGESKVILPSPMFNALFVPFHCAGHFVHGEASLKQLCDWACFVNKCGDIVDWDTVRKTAEKYGFWKFYCCLNGIVLDHLGVSVSCLPAWPRNLELEKRVLDAILAPHKKNISLVRKVINYFSSRWKYKLVYKDNMLLTSIRKAKSYIRFHNEDSASIWDIQKQYNSKSL